MAKTVKKAQKEEAVSTASVINTEEAPKKMSKADAEAIVKKYAGINGVRIPELQKAKEILREK